MTVRQLCFSPSGYRRLRQAIEAAGLPKKERLGSPYERYMADKDRERDALEKEGVMAMRTMVDVERMLVEINEQGRLPDEASRARYLRSVYGGNPLRRIRKMRKRCERDGVEYRDFRRAGSLACWAPLNGATPFDSRWDRWSGGDGPADVNWIDARPAAAATEELPIEEWSGRQLLEWECPRRRRPGD